MSVIRLADHRSPTDDEIVARLRDPNCRTGYLRGTVAGMRDGMAWAASVLPDSPSRRLLEQRIAEADRALALVERACS